MIIAEEEEGGNHMIAAILCYFNLLYQVRWRPCTKSAISNMGRREYCKL
jgi:hypothetical protein